MDLHPLIGRFGLAPHPEGGWYRELHRSASSVERADGERRSGLTAILFLLGAGAVSRWHRVCGADETWHYAAGDPLELLVLPPQTGLIERQRLGPVVIDGPAHCACGDPMTHPLAVVPAGCWQAARSLGQWTL